MPILIFLHKTKHTSASKTQGCHSNLTNGTVSSGSKYLHSLTQHTVFWQRGALRITVTVPLVLPTGRKPIHTLTDVGRQSELFGYGSTKQIFSLIKPKERMGFHMPENWSLQE